MLNAKLNTLAFHLFSLSRGTWKCLTELTPPFLTELPHPHHDISFSGFMQMNSKIRNQIPRVELYEDIRRGVNFKGLSIREAASQFKIHRREVRNALAFAISLEHKVVPKRRPKLGQHEATVRKWLAEDVDLQRKRRHTATRIGECLIDECGADVSPSALRVMANDLLGHLGAASVLRPRGVKKVCSNLASQGDMI